MKYHRAGIKIFYLLNMLTESDRTSPLLINKPLDYICSSLYQQKHTLLSKIEI